MNAAPPPQRPQQSAYFPWYDSVWLSAFERAQELIQSLRPGFMGEFVGAFEPFRTRPEFEVKHFESVFDEATLGEIRRVTASLVPTQLELHEARAFKRFVVHNHPLFNELQQRVVDWVSEAAGEEVEPSYNFLSLYGPGGVCPVHLDSPQAKWTLDLCINQSEPWPIHFSRVQPWPRPENGRWLRQGWEEDVKGDKSNGFRSMTMRPGEALLFSGPSQWHYRDEMPGNGGNRSCDLLFFHFIPRGLAQLADPANWARLFAMPELEGCALEG